jgi:hypothetical protein
VVEARNPAGELFGFDRTAPIVTQPAKQIANPAQQFGQEDNITVLTLTFALRGTACIGSRCSCRFSWEPSRLGGWQLSASAIMRSVEEGQNCSTGTEDERIFLLVRNRLTETDAMKQFGEAGIRAKGIELDGVTSVERKCVLPEGLIQ